jgi:heme-degrading monooxygenase HmoA
MARLRDDVFIMIVIFETAGREQQDVLIDGVGGEVDTWVSKLPGFVASAFHRSEDGHRVVNYAQWRSREDWEAFTRRPEGAGIGTHIKAAGAKPIHGGSGPFILAKLIEPDLASDAVGTVSGSKREGPR